MLLHCDPIQVDPSTLIQVVPRHLVKEPLAVSQTVPQPLESTKSDTKSITHAFHDTSEKGPAIDRYLCYKKYLTTVSIGALSSCLLCPTTRPSQGHALTAGRTLGAPALVSFEIE